MKQERYSSLLTKKLDMENTRTITDDSGRTLRSIKGYYKRQVIKDVEEQLGVKEYEGIYTLVEEINSDQNAEKKRQMFIFEKMSGMPIVQGVIFENDELVKTLDVEQEDIVGILKGFYSCQQYKSITEEKGEIQ